MQINILEAKNRLSELIRTVEQGGEVVIAKRGKPVARLVSTSLQSGNPIGEKGAASTILAFLKANPLPVHSQRSHEEIEEIIAQAREWD